MVTVGLGPPKVDDLETSMVESESGSCSRSSGEPSGQATASDRVERCRTIEPRYPRGIDGSNSSYPTTLQQYFPASGEVPMDQETLTYGTYIGVDVHRFDGSNELQITPSLIDVVHGGFQSVENPIVSTLGPQTTQTTRFP